MQIQCRYCGSYISDTDIRCPNCGATNEDLNRSAHDTPRTIAELQQWYVNRKLPPYEVTRFFIGENKREPKCFGIYKDDITGNITVYKNKADGSRAVRYEGKDEAYAVNEIYMKMKEEILNQKSYNMSNSERLRNRQSSSSNSSNRIYNKILKIILIYFGIQIIIPIIIAIVNLVAAFTMPSNEMGYFVVDNHLYYHNQDGSVNYWAEYDDNLDVWNIIDNPKPKINKYVTSTWTENYDNEYGLSVVTHPHDMAWSKELYSSKTNHIASNYYSSGFAPASDNYYEYDDDLYYYQGYQNESNWYKYDEDTWTIVDIKDVPDDLYYNSKEYLSNFSNYDIGDGYVDFKDTDYYSAYNDRYDDYIMSYRYSSSSSYDSDSSYDSYSNDSYYDNDYDYDWDSGDDWDSGWSDWDSDW